MINLQSYALGQDIPPITTDWLVKVISTNQQIVRASLDSTYRYRLSLLRRVPIIRDSYFPLQYTKKQSYFWFSAMNIKALLKSYKLFRNNVDLDLVSSYFDEQLENNQQWLSPIERVDHLMKGASLIDLDALTQKKAYSRALFNLYLKLTQVFPRTEAGIYCYAQNNRVLVDTLGMICPFLSKYGREYDVPEASSMCVNQLLDYIRVNVDDETHLPFHGYYNGGARRLGSLGWGRGTGWYLLGIVDSLCEIGPNANGFEEIRNAFQSATVTIKKYQKEDGTWSWSILQPQDHSDTTATAFLGYCLSRGILTGLIGQEYLPTLEAALKAIINHTNIKNGSIGSGLRDCEGLGRYPHVFGAQPWLQGIALSFALEFAACKMAIQGTASDIIYQTSHE